MECCARYRSTAASYGVAEVVNEQVQQGTVTVFIKREQPRFPVVGELASLTPAETDRRIVAAAGGAWPPVRSEISPRNIIAIFDCGVVVLGMIRWARTSMCWFWIHRSQGRSTGCGVGSRLWHRGLWRCDSILAGDPSGGMHHNQQQQQQQRQQQRRQQQQHPPLPPHTRSSMGILTSTTNPDFGVVVRRGGAARRWRRWTSWRDGEVFVWWGALHLPGHPRHRGHPSIDIRGLPRATRCLCTQALLREHRSHQSATHPPSMRCSVAAATYARLASRMHLRVPFHEANNPGLTPGSRARYGEEAVILFLKSSFHAWGCQNGNEQPWAGGLAGSEPLVALALQHHIECFR
jgi:hypothetical protein